MNGFRFAVRVKPGSRRDAVGGRWDAGQHTALVVAVTAPASAGRANDAVCRVLAAAFGVRRREVRIVSGERAREKQIEIAGAPADAASRLDELLG
ncbi:MAG: DUF167 domain-containing protein [Streptosporangiales bacterium]|nr:DUF167 domain-containing protein [Streptosporangiales bacterium]